MGLEREWRDEEWEDYYTLNYGDKRIIDAAVLWRKDSYIPNTFMCLSFQYQKHLSLGRGGVILLDNEEDFIILKKASRFKLLMLLQKVFSGKHIRSRLIKVIQTNHLKIETQTPQILNLDGEVIGNTPLEIIMYHQKLKVICEL